MIILLGFAFLSGLVTILAPCIWPLLPIILSSSVAGKGHQRPLGITFGIMLSFAIFTLTVSSLVRIFHFDPNILRLFAVVVIGFLGLTIIIPALSEVIELWISKLSGLWGQKGQQQGTGFIAGFITGFSLGVVWSPCAGPILATIATLAATGQVTGGVILVTLAYAIGVGIPLFIFAYGGQQIIAKTRFISSQTGRIRQIFGIIMLLTALAIYTNYDKVLQVKLLDVLPQFGVALNNFEGNSAVKQQLDILRGKQSLSTNSADTSGLFNINTPALDFIGITKWLNTDTPISIHDLKGKVVLVDFWTYTCINCIRTLPHVTAWYDKYKDQGFVVIGVHTPEFEFEKDSSNVLNAIKQYNIHYPVPQDNNYATWNNYSNQYWPAEYLIDTRGNIRRTHFGEGEYDETERAIQVLLKESGQQINTSVLNITDQTPKNRQSPETYLGSSKMQYYYPSGSISNGQQSFTLSDNLPKNYFSFGGEWNIMDEYATSGKNATLSYNFYSNRVHLVLRPGGNNNGKIRISIDGKVVDSSNAGEDVKEGTVNVNADRLYTLIDLHGKAENHILKLEFQTPGIEAFAFTFG